MRRRTPPTGRVHPEAGAYAGIALGLQVLLSALLLPLAAHFWNGR